MERHFVVRSTCLQMEHKLRTSISSTYQREFYNRKKLCLLKSVFLTHMANLGSKGLFHFCNTITLRGRQHWRMAKSLRRPSECYWTCANFKVIKIFLINRHAQTRIYNVQRGKDAEELKAVVNCPCTMQCIKFRFLFLKYKYEELLKFPSRIPKVKSKQCCAGRTIVWAQNWSEIMGKDHRPFKGS